MRRHLSSPRVQPTPAGQYRLQWHNSLGPDAQVFSSIGEAATYAESHFPPDWLNGLVWIIEEEQP